MRSSKRVVASDNNCNRIIAQNAAIDAAADQLIRMADSNNGRLPHQAMENAILGLSMLGKTVVEVLYAIESK
jgi:DNA-binding FrmR family transcriptional regulator